MHNAAHCLAGYGASRRVAASGLACAVTLLLSQSLRAQTEADDVVLAHRGRLKVQAYYSHGPAPLVLVVTEAPASAGAAERRYRTAFTAQLIRYIEMHGFSYYVVRDAARADSVAETAEQGMSHLEAAAREAVAALGRKGLPPVAYVGLAEGAVIAARLATEDSLPRSLAALSPSLATTGPKGPPHWDEAIHALNERLSQLLAMQSVCDGPMPAALIHARRGGQRLLLLPDLDSWLGYLPGTGCAKAPPLQVSGEIAPMVAEWLRGSVGFPE